VITDGPHKLDGASVTEGQRRWDAHFARTVDDWVKLYDKQTLSAVIHVLRRAIALQWVGELALPAAERILEVGCGPGLTTVALARDGYVVEAVDRVPGMLQRTRDLAAEWQVSHRVSTTLGDAHELTFPAGRFGLVLALGVMPFLDRPRQALAEMTRVLKPGGWVLVNTDNRWRLGDVLDPWLSPPLDPVRGTVGAVLRGLGLRRRAQYTGPVAWVFTNSQVDAWLRLAGLERARSMTYGFGPFSFLGRNLLAESTGVRLHRMLQRYADRNVPVLRSTGAQYIVLARKTGATIS